MSKNYFDVLGVDKNSSTTDIKKAYKKLAMKYHPDRLNDLSSEQQIASEEKFKEINEAYEVLLNPKKRRDYIEINFKTTTNPRKIVRSFWKTTLQT